MNIEPASLKVLPDAKMHFCFIEDSFRFYEDSKYSEELHLMEDIVPWCPDFLAYAIV